MTWWKDIDISLEKKFDGDINDFVDEYAIIESIKNIFRTVQGQRRWLMPFAINLYNLLFDPIDDITARDIGEIMLQTIEMWDNRVIIEDLLVKPNPEQNQYDVSLTFRLNNVASPQTYTIQETIKAA